MRRLAVLALALLVAPVTLPTVAPTAPAASFLTEDWETGSDGWVFSGSGAIGVHCGWGAPGCSLWSHPDEGTEHAATRALDLPIPTDATLVVEMQFYNNLTSNSLQPSLQVLLDSGYVNLSLNRDETETLQLRTSAGSTTWAHYERFEWYTVQILLRGGKVMARFAGPDAPGFWDSATLDLPGATRVTAIRLHNSHYEPWRETEYFFDNIRVYDVPTCFPFSTSIGASTPYGEWPLATGFKPVVTGGHALCPATWSVDFGDGTPAASGTGLPPAFVPHVYEGAGDHAVTYTLTVAGETIVRALRVTAVDCLPLWLRTTVPASEGDAPFAAEVSARIGSTLARCAATWSFDPGDGSAPVTGSGVAPTIAHTYDTPGVHQATLTVQRGAQSASMTKIFAAGPYAEPASGSFLLGARNADPLGMAATSVALRPTDGSDTLSLTWRAPGLSDVDVSFTREGAAIGQACVTTAPYTYSGCPVPAGADAYVVSLWAGALVEWQSVVTYA